MHLEILSVIEPYLGSGRSVAGGKEYQYRCPFCKAESHHFYVNYERLQFVCHSGRCGTKGTLEYLARRLGIDPGLISSYVPSESSLRCRILGVSTYNHIQPIKDPGLLTLIRPGMYAWDYLTKEYPEGRGICPEDVMRYGLSVSSRDGYERIYFTEMDDVGNIVFWVARKYLPRTFGPKYINAGGSNRSNVFRIRDVDPSKPVDICEGPISAMVASSNAVATYGVEVTDNQLDAIAKLNAKEYLISMDGDAFRYSVNIAERLRNMGKVAKIVPMPHSEDPASLGRSKYQDCVKRSYELEVGSTRNLRERLVRLW